ncbi:hypothetical protein AO935_17305 [Pseudomonas aeruginosa]|nr:hypothetical protein AO935_17305 [Pseudomonas aeruginosa]
MRRIEEVSGRSLDGTADVATLWFALQAARLSPNAGAASWHSPRTEAVAWTGGEARYPELAGRHQRQPARPVYAALLRPAVAPLRAPLRMH